MAYNPYSAVKAIYNLKGQWDSADKVGDSKRATAIAGNALQYYDQLRANGYDDVADQLSASNYTQAKAINDKWAKTGKTPTRDYLYSLGKSRGMTSDDVDKLISWDDVSGEVSFGGKKIGTPDAVVDGVSYWTDTSILDNAFNDYIDRSGTTRDRPTAVNQENEKLFAKYNQEYEDLKNTNPFETETGKAILAKYDLAGLQGRDNEVASGASSNGGNIDSFAAANALRQQSALVNQGQMVALEAHQQKLDHARALLSDMGVNIDRVFNEDETAKNNDVARKSEIAGVTGYVPTEWSVQNDAFLKNFVDENGKLKAEYYDTDFQELINNAKANGNTDLANKYAILRGLKIFGNFSEYGKYLNEGDIAYPSAQRTADYDLTTQQIASAENIAKGENDTTLALADKEANSAINQINAQTQGEKEIIQESAKYGTSKEPTMTYNQAKSALEDGVLTEAVLDAYNTGVGGSFTMDNPPPVYKPASDGTTKVPGVVAPFSAFANNSSSGTVGPVIGGTNPAVSTPTQSGNSSAPLTDAQVKEWANKLNDSVPNKYGSKYKAVAPAGNGKYKVADTGVDYIVKRIYESNELTAEQKEYLLYDKFGVTTEQVTDVVKDPHYK